MVNGAKQLPDGWTWVTIGEIATNINPGFPSGRHNQEKLGVPHIRPMNISREGDIDLSVVKYVEAVDYLPLLQGDVLFNNTNSPELVGKTTYIRQDTNWAYSNHMTRIRLDRATAYPAWVANALHYLFLDGYFKQNCRHHVNQASVSSGFLSQNVKVPLPPLPEQERIVAKIEELFTQLEAGTSALAKVQAGLRRYKASVLKAAVEGKLFENRELDNSGKLPEGWRVEKVGSLFEVKIGKTPSRSKPEFWNGDIPWVSSGEVKNSRIKGTRELITSSGLGTSRLHPVGTVLLAMIGEGKTRGQAALLDISATTNQNIAAILPNICEAIPEWIFHWLLSRYEETRKSGSGGMQYALNSERIRNFDVPLPPLEEQRRIVAEVERRLSVAREVEAAVEAALVRASRLRQAVLKSAFEGRLRS